MALSMEEQRLLAEIERGLAAEDPLLAARLSAFKHPGVAITLRLRRARLLASVASVVAVAAVSIVAYLFVPFAHRAAPAREMPGAPAISETGTKASQAAPRHGSEQGHGIGQTGPGSSLGPVPGSTPASSRGPLSGSAPGPAAGSTSGASSGAAGATQNPPSAAPSRAPAVSRSAASPAAAGASSAPAR